MFAKVLKRWEIAASTGSHFDVLDGLRGGDVRFFRAGLPVFFAADFEWNSRPLEAGGGLIKNA